MSKSQQRKGRVAELQLCRLLQSYGIPAEPGQAVSFGSTPDITGIPHVHAEVKRTEKMRMNEWLDQAQRDAARFGGCPAIFHRSNRRPWTVTMLLTDWIAIYKAHECQCGGHCNRQETVLYDPKERGYTVDSKTRESYSSAFDVSHTGGGSKRGWNRFDHIETLP